MQLAHTSGLDGDQRGGDMIRGREITGIDDASFTPDVFFVGAIDAILKVYRMGDSTFLPPTADLSCASEPGSSAGNM
jgi:hypothetical protein